MEAISSELNLFEPPVIQSAIEGETVQEFGPLATIIQGAPIDFQIEGGGGKLHRAQQYKVGSAREAHHARWDGYRAWYSGGCGEHSVAFDVRVFDD